MGKKETKNVKEKATIKSKEATVDRVPETMTKEDTTDAVLVSTIDADTILTDENTITEVLEDAVSVQTIDEVCDDGKNVKTANKKLKTKKTAKKSAMRVLKKVVNKKLKIKKAANKLVKILTKNA